MANNRFFLDRRLMVLSAFALTGCGGLGLGPTDTNNIIYMLQPATAAAPGGQPATWALAVDIPDASNAIDTRRIALVEADGTMDYYASAEWPDRLPLLVQTALIASFEASGRAPSVARVQDALHADYELGLDLRDFSAHYSSADGAPSVTVNIVAQMTTAHGRKIVATFTASESTPASQNSTAAVVTAFNTALGTAVGKIVAWALTLPAPASP